MFVNITRHNQSSPTQCTDPSTVYRVALTQCYLQEKIELYKKKKNELSKNLKSLKKKLYKHVKGGVMILVMGRS